MNFLILINLMVVSVGFFMLLERKILGVVQFRLGPNKILFKGWIQFMKDFLKLIIKNILDLKNFYFYWVLMIMFILFMIQILLWVLLPFESIYMNLKLVFLILFLLMLLKLVVFMFLIWMAYSVYSTMSIYRMLVQVISSDVIIVLILLLMIYLTKKFSMFNLLNLKLLNFLMSLMVLSFWLLGILVEMIRLPYDFYESESELISGFTIEISSFSFILLILMEYLEMIFFMFIFLVFFFNMFMFSFFGFFIIGVLTVFLIYIRSIFIRHRFDKMLMLMWKFMFPLLLVNLIFIFLISSS